MTVTYTVTDAQTGCSTAVTADLTVDPLPIVAAIAGGATNVCLNSSTVAFTDATVPGVWSIQAGTGNATITTGGVVTGTAAGTVTVTYTVTDGTSGCVNAATQTLTVDALPVIAAIGGGGTNVCLNSTTAPFTDATTGGTWSILAGSGTATITTGGAVTGTGVGVVTVVYTVTSGTTGCTSEVTQDLTIDPLPTVAAIGGGQTDVCINSSTVAFTDATTGGTWNVENGTGTATITTGGVVTGTAEGTVTVTYTVSDGTCSASTTAPLTVHALPVVAAITGTSTLNIGTTTQLADATAGGTWSSDTPANATVDQTSGLVSGVGVGTATITYSFTDGNGCTSEQTLLVTINAAAAITITADYHKIYGSLLTGPVIVNSPDFTIVSGTMLPGDDISSVTLDFAAGTQSTDPATTYTGSVTVSGATGTFNPANYIFNYTNGNLIVDPAELTITATSVIKQFGTELISAMDSLATDFTAVGLQNGEVIDSLFINYGNGALATDPAGPYPGQVSVSTPYYGHSTVDPLIAFDPNNYAITTVPGDITVEQAGVLTIVARPVNKEYGALLTGFTGNSSPLYGQAFATIGLQNLDIIDHVTIEYGDGAAINDPVGTYQGQVKISNAGGTSFNPANYSGIVYEDGDIIIGKKALTVTAESKSKPYDGATYSPFTSTITGFVSPDNVSVVTGSVTYSGSAVVAKNAGSYVISPVLTGLDATNYSFTGVNGTLTIGTIPLTITAKDVQKPHGNVLTRLVNVSASSYITYSVLATGETLNLITISFGPGWESSAPVGPYPGSVIPSAPVGLNFKTTNYDITYVPGTITVGKVPLTITADNKNKCYDGAAYSGGFSVTPKGFINGDDWTSLTGTLTYSGTAFPAKTAVGSYTIIPAGYSSDKYDITYVSGTLAINDVPAAFAGSAQTICSGTQLYLGSPAVSGHTYSWSSVPAGALPSIAQPSVTPDVTTTYTLVEKITATGCENSNSVKITVNPTPAAVAYVGPAPAICTGDAVSLGTAAVSGNTYSWTSIPSGFTSTVANPTDTPLSSTTYYLTETNTASQCSATNHVVVTVNSIPSPNLDGEIKVCQGSEVVYGTESAKVGYAWEISSGGSIVEGGTSTDYTVKIKWNSEGAQWVKVNYTNGTSCNAVAPAVLNVTVTPGAGDAGVITGPTAVCAGTKSNYSVAAIANATTYSWVLPDGATFDSGEGTQNIVVNYALNATSGTITVKGKSACSSGAASNLDISVTEKPGDAGEILGETSFSAGTFGAEYSVAPIDNVTNYEWTLPAGATIATGAGTNSITVDFGATAVAGNITVVGSNTCSSGAPSSLSLSVPDKKFSLYPVPSDGTFTAAISFPVESTFNIAIYDHLGNKIMEIEDAKTVGGEYHKLINLGSISNGLYFVKFYNASFNEVRKLLINR